MEQILNMIAGMFFQTFLISTLHEFRIMWYIHIKPTLICQYIFEYQEY